MGTSIINGYTVAQIQVGHAVECCGGKETKCTLDNFCKEQSDFVASAIADPEDGMTCSAANAYFYGKTCDWIEPESKQKMALLLAAAPQCCTNKDNKCTATSSDSDGSDSG